MEITSIDDKVLLGINANFELKRRLLDFGLIPNKTFGICMCDDRRGYVVEIDGVVILLDNEIYHLLEVT